MSNVNIENDDCSDEKIKVRASSAEALHRMQACRGENTKPEQLLNAAMTELGLQFERQRCLLDGLRRKVDFVFDAARVAIFVDGCFWHGCSLHGTSPKQNALFWRKKIEENRRRDNDTNSRLEEAGWLVLRYWEHEDMLLAAEQIVTVVESRRELIDES